MRQALLSIPTFPDAVPERCVESACTLAQLLGVHLTVQLLQLSSDRSTWPPVIGAYPLSFPEMMNELVAMSEANAAEAATRVTAECATHGVALDLRRGLTTAYAQAAPLVDLARLHDLTILPVPEADAFGRSTVKDVLFGSGRPIVLLPSNHRRLARLDCIVMAWDYSREAARALVDALPLMQRARRVRLVTVTGEKHVQTSAGRGDLEKFLGGHGLPFSLDEIAFEGGAIGGLLMNYAVDAGADMLVMGAYGHPRLQEFVLGGATRAILREPLLPVLLSH